MRFVFCYLRFYVRFMPRAPYSSAIDIETDYFLETISSAVNDCLGASIDQSICVVVTIKAPANCILFSEISCMFFFSPEMCGLPEYCSNFFYVAILMMHTLCYPHEHLTLAQLPAVIIF